MCIINTYVDNYSMIYIAKSCYAYVYLHNNFGTKVIQRNEQANNNRFTQQNPALDTGPEQQAALV